MLLDSNRRPADKRFFLFFFFCLFVCLFFVESVHTEMLKVPYYTVFCQFHTAVRDPTTLNLKCIAPNPPMVLNFSCLKVTQMSSTESRLFLCLNMLLSLFVCVVTVRTMRLMLAPANGKGNL